MFQQLHCCVYRELNLVVSLSLGQGRNDAMLFLMEEPDHPNFRSYVVGGEFSELILSFFGLMKVFLVCIVARSGMKLK